MIDATEADRRIEMIRRGWSEMLTPESLQLALRLCNQEFRTEPVFSVKRFVDRLTELHDYLLPNKGLLFRTLLTSSTSTANNRVSSTAKPANSVTEVNGWSLIFNHMLKELTATFRLISNSALRSLQAYLLKNAKLVGAARLQMQDWLDTGVPNFTKEVTQPEMHQILHHTYLWACIEMGPIDADKHLSRAVKSAATLPEAIHYRPQSLL